MTVTTDPPTSKQTPEQVLLLSGLRSVLREELQKTEDKLGLRLAGVEETVGSVKADLRTLEKRVDGIESRIEEKIEETLASRSQISNAPPEDNYGLLQRNGGRSSRREENYCRARRSLRMWPISGDPSTVRQSLHEFLATKLKMDNDALIEADECIVRKVARSRNSNIEGEVIVEFPSVELRDAVRSSAYNLAGQTGAGIRLEIPSHLMNNFKALNQAGYRLKQKFPKCRRNIKFDDEVNNLVMEFKTTETTPWRRLHPEHARQLESVGRVEDVTAADLSEMLGGAAAGGGAEEDEEESDST